MKYEIWVLHDGIWVACAEGAFDSYEAAVAFAEAEVGLPWVVMEA